MLAWLPWIAGAYLLGSVPFGVLIGRARGIDIRAHGSRNIGATNVGRVLGRPLGTLCFGLDLLKGALPVIGAGLAHGVLGAARPADIAPPDQWLWLAVAVAAVAGHMASIFLRFGGGKGVATSFGALAAMWSLLTVPALAAIAVWYLTLRLTRYVSLASMAAAASIPIWYVARILVADAADDPAAALAHASPPLVVTAALAALVAWRHRGNLRRLRRGEEPKAGRPAR